MCVYVCFCFAALTPRSAKKLVTSVKEEVRVEMQAAALKKQLEMQAEGRRQLLALQTAAAEEKMRVEVAAHERMKELATRLSDEQQLKIQRWREARRDHGGQGADARMRRLDAVVWAPVVCVRWMRSCGAARSC